MKAIVLNAEQSKILLNVLNEVMIKGSDAEMVISLKRVLMTPRDIEFVQPKEPIILPGEPNPSLIPVFGHPESIKTEPDRKP